MGKGTDWQYMVKGTDQRYMAKGTDQLHMVKRTLQLYMVQGTDQLYIVKGTDRQYMVKGADQLYMVKRTDQLYYIWLLFMIHGCHLRGRKKSIPHGGVIYRHSQDRILEWCRDIYNSVFWVEEQILSIPYLGRRYRYQQHRTRGVRYAIQVISRPFLEMKYRCYNNVCIRG